MTFPGIFPLTFLPAGIIKSVQTVEITIAAGASSNTATIAVVETGYSAIFQAGKRSADTSYVATEDSVSFALTNATTITANTATANAGSSRIGRCTVVEFYSSAVSSVQTGIINATGTSDTATITAVDTARSVAYHSGYIFSGASNDWNYQPGEITLTNATTVTRTRNSSAVNTLTVQYTVIQFAPGIVNSIQHISLTSSTNATGDTAINAVNDATSFIFWGGFTLTTFASNNNQRHPYYHRTSTTNVRLTRGAAAASITTGKCAVVEFNPQYVMSRQANQTAIAINQTSQTDTINSVNTSKSLLLWSGQTVGASNAGGYGIVFATVKLNSATQAIAERGATSATIAVTNAYEVGEFI